MRIQQLTFQNLNSLTGTWKIDFCHPVFTESGIFAITGPTGAGKSTILDAICLALYGETPRLSRISKVTNELMSRRTGECFAELQFETNKGTYLCRWSQRRAHNKADGELQQPKHEISLFPSGELLETKLSGVKARVEEVTGMDFTRFTRSMLLAQGGFDAFLKAEINERSSILEEITGTDIYSEISIMVYNRKSQLHTEYKELAAAAGAITILSSTECELLQAQLRQTTEAEKAAKEVHETISNKLKWAENIQRLEREIQGYDSGLQAVNLELTDFAPQLIQLQKMRQAIPLKADFVAIESLHLRLREQDEELCALQSSRQELQHQEACIQDAVQRDTKLLAEAETQDLQEQNTFTQVCQLDSKLCDLHKAFNDAELDLIARSKKCLELHRELQPLTDQLAKCKKELVAAELYRSQNSAHSALPSIYKALDQQLQQLVELQKKILLHQSKRQQADPTAKQAEQNTLSTGIGILHQALSQIAKDIAASSEAQALLLAGKPLAIHRQELQKTSQVSAALYALRDSFESHAQQQAKVHELNSTITQDEADLQTRDAQLQALSTKLVFAEEVLRSATTQLQQARQILDWEEERQKLQADSPCPLCGSIQHPFATTAIPNLDVQNQALQQAQSQEKELQSSIRALEKLQNQALTRLQINRKAIHEIDLHTKTQDLQARQSKLGISELSIQILDLLLQQNARDLNAKTVLIEAADSLQGKQEALNSEHIKLQNRYLADQNLLHAVQLELQSQLSEAERYQQALSELQDQSFALQSSLAEHLKPFDIELHTASKLPKIALSLAIKNQAWASITDQILLLGSQIQGLQLNIAGKEQLLQNHQQELDGIKLKASTLHSEIDSQKQSRQALLGEEPVKEAEDRWQARLRKLRIELQATQQKHTKNQADIAANIHAQTRSSQQRSQLDAKRQVQETAFHALLQEHGFAGFEDFQASILTPEQLDTLQRQEQNLLARKTGLLAKLTENRSQLQIEGEKALTNKPLSELQAQATACQISINELNKEQGVLETKLNDNARQQQMHFEQIQKLNAHQLILERWEKLSELIGSADGKKYRTFAQGITFEMLIARANVQLQKLSDRYLLIDNERSPLDLFIVDAYQGGEVRTVKNLSGGESFLVSLALALGLSKMSSQNVSIDSLFLDEGFGALDEKSLDLALENLAALNSEGKLIGLISHVGAIKDRIPNQIQVIPVAGGMSQIKGIGCTELKD